MTSTFQPSVCIDAVFEGLELEEALAGVVSSGLKAFEFWAWWEKDLDALRRGRDRYGLAIASCCTRFISLVDPSTRDAYLEGLQESIDSAQALDCPTLISQVGQAREGVPREEQRDCLIAGLREAVPMLESAGITLVIEPLNVLVDHPGYYLVRSHEAFKVVDAVGSSRVKVVYDIYHQQISEGQLLANILPNLGVIGHFHAAGNPGRHELDQGEIHYPAIFQAIAEAGYQGYVGLEYWPEKPAGEGLRRVASWFGMSGPTS